MGQKVDYFLDWCDRVGAGAAAAAAGGGKLCCNCLICYFLVLPFSYFVSFMPPLHEFLIHFLIKLYCHNLKSKDRGWLD